MKLAVVCPIGRLDRYGYQHVADTCMQTHRRVSVDRFYMSTSRANAPDAEKGIVSDERTWFDLDEEGHERFDIGRLEMAANLGYRMARDAGFDVAVGLHVNNLVTRIGADWLYWEARRIHRGKEFFAYTYRCDQLADRAFGATVRRPRIINLHADPLPEVGPDVLTMDGEVVAKMERGDWPNMDNLATWDIQLEMTLPDLEDKLNFQRCYSDLVPKRKPTFEWGYWRRYYATKYRQKRRIEAEAPLHSPADFVSWEIVAAL